jgi:uncharacterized damage-inducible protein DinB
MTIEDLRTLLDYHYWARDRMLAAIEPLTAEQYTRDLGNSFISICDTAVHIYAAEWIWYARWQGENPTALLTADRFPDVASLRAVWAEHEAKMRAYVETMGEQRALERVIEYRLLSGDPGASPFWHMLQHVVNHASYHRGQVTTMLRQIGAPPAKPMDLIAYYRTRPARA